MTIENIYVAGCRGWTAQKKRRTQLHSSHRCFAHLLSRAHSFVESGARVHCAELLDIIDWDSKVAYLGYWLSKKSEGNGIMTKCCQALFDHAFEEYKLNRVAINVATENHRSQAIPDRLGFKREGVLREAEWLYDHFVDHTVNALLRSEWQSNRAPETSKYGAERPAFVAQQNVNEH